MKRLASAFFSVLVSASAPALAQEPAPSDDDLRAQVEALAAEVDALKRAANEPAEPADPTEPAEDDDSADEPDWTDTIRLGLFYVESADKAFKLQIKGRLMVDSRHVVNREDFDDHFQLRRARIEFIGHLYERLHYSIGLEFGRTSDADLRNAFLDLEVCSEFQVRAGQMLLPYSDLRLRSSKYLSHPERTMLVANMVGNRDIGVAAHGTLGGVVDYELGGFGGAGQNARVDTDDEVDLAARIVVRPFSDYSLAFSVNGIWTPERTDSAGPGDVRTVGNQFTTFLDYASDNEAHGDRYRVGAGFLFSEGPFELTAELNVDYHKDVRSALGARENLLSWGWHLAGQWVLTGETLNQKFDGPKVKPDEPFYDPESKAFGLGALALAVRYEELRADREVLRGGFATGTRGARAGTGSLHWYLWESVRLTASYTYTHFEDAVTDSTGDDANDDHGVLARMAFYF